MTEKHEELPNHLQNEPLQDESISDQTLYAEIANDSIRYILSEKRYVIISIILPLIIILCQIANFVLVILAFRASDRTSPRPPPVFDLITPVFIFTIVTIFMLVHIFYLIKWNFKVKKYSERRELAIKNSIAENGVKSDEFVSLSQIFYDIVNHMRNIRFIFIALNFVSILYLTWIIRQLLMRLLIIVHRDPPFPLPWFILNSVVLVALIIYLGFQWKHFLKWNRKLSKLDEFERRVYQELEFES